MIKINVITNNTNWLKYIKYPDDYLNKRVKKINLKDKEFKKNKIYCTLLLSGNQEIKYLNKKFRNKNKPTDVLSFPFLTKKEFKKELKEKKEIYLGDIIVNLSKIKKKNINFSFKDEFDRLWIHGLVHLLGHDHKNESDYLSMSKVEKKYLKFIND
jgi:probable rRNA maturation factor|tara:strand:+ start:242 stop:709 length:468 start_codon:yes stop_codon:yes gene_type:complete